MKLQVWTSDGGSLTFRDFDSAGLLELLDEFRDPEAEVLTFDMDGALVYVNRAHIVRIDVED
jgi:hypothetical protein